MKKTNFMQELLCCLQKNTQWFHASMICYRIESMLSNLKSAGYALPQKRYSNAELIAEYNIESTSEWIEQMTGIQFRYFVEGKDEFEKIVTESLKNALENAKLDKADLDGVIVASSTNYYHFPGLSQIVHHNLNLKSSVYTLDINAACNGFMQGLFIANDLIKFHGLKNIAVIGADAMSSILDMSDRNTCCLFGDGSGCVILSAEDDSQKRGILASKYITDAQNYKSLIAKSNVEMNGRSVFESSVVVFENLIQEVLSHVGMSVHDIDLFILHQANIRIFQNVAKRVGISEEKIPFYGKNFGNISAATIPVSLAFAMQDISFNQKNLVLAGFGAGFTAMANVISCKK